MALLEAIIAPALVSGLSAAAKKTTIIIGIKSAAAVAGNIGSVIAADGIQKSADKKFEQKAREQINEGKIKTDKDVETFYKKYQKKTAFKKALAGGAIGGTCAVAGEAVNIATMNKIENGTFSIPMDQLLPNSNLTISSIMKGR